MFFPKRSFVLFFLFVSVNLFSQKDSIKLPFALSDEKKLSDEDLANKKEGTYITGVPDLSSDPINGFGVGAEGQLFFNGKRTDPFFAYTPYRAEINLALFYTTRAQREIRMECEFPYIFNTKWRLHGELGYEVDPNLLYFGVSENSLKPLSYFPNGDTTKTVNNAMYSDYENSLSGRKRFYNTYQKEELITNWIVSRAFMEGKMRIFMGIEVAQANYTTPQNDSSLLHNDARAGKILGYGKFIVPMLQGGVVYDTRDLETDPSKGIFAEYMNEFSSKKIGWSFNIFKTFIHVNIYQKILPKVFKKCVFAASIGFAANNKDIPFYELLDQESSEKSIMTLGGSQTLRGFKQGRFAAPVLQYDNFEMRIRFFQHNFFKQHFSFSAVPFFDMGGVWDSLDRMSHTENFRYSEGFGLRVGWNENTTLRFDFAVSKEDRQFFFALQQPF